jgi:hypothetical protein
MAEMINQSCEGINESSPPSNERDQWQQEFAYEQNEPHKAENPYPQLIRALQKLPKSDQAEVAKILLKHLKSIQNG